MVQPAVRGPPHPLPCPGTCLCRGTLGEGVGALASDEGEEPDYRFSLANERTFLAYIRTSLALLAGGVAVEQIVPSFGVPGFRATLSVLLLALASFVAGSSYRRWRLTERAMRRQRPLPATRLPLVLGVSLSATAVGILTVVVYKALT